MHRTTRRIARLLIPCFLLLCALNAYPQGGADTGSIYGVVSDGTGALVSGAKVKATNESTGLEREATSGRDGYYDLPQLRVGRYRLSVDMTGFKTHVSRGVIVNVTEATRTDVVLQVGAIAETVEVEASGVAAVETRDNTLGGVIEERRVVQMPLNGRNFIQLSYFEPGVTVNYRTITLRGAQESATGGVKVQPWVNGMKNTMNAYFIDGALNNDPVLNFTAIVPVTDSIQEFKIQTNMYMPEFGQAGGSVVSIVTKSGGQTPHGAAYYFTRNDALDARNYFLPDVLALKRHQFGANLGGPIGKKTFYFGHYEGLRLTKGVPVNSLVPSVLERQGNFSVVGATLRDPVGGCITSSTPGGPLNIVSPSCMDPVAVGLISRLWPEPNVGTNQFQAAPTLTNDRNQYMIKLDHVRTKHTFAGRYVIDYGEEINPIPGAQAGSASLGVPGFPVANPSRAQNVVFSDSFLISPQSLNVFRFSFLRSHFVFNEIVGTRDNPADFGFTYPTNPALGLAMPEVTVGIFAPTGAPRQKDDRKANNMFVVADSFSHEVGAHSFRFGGEFRRTQSNIFNGSFNPGLFRFTGAVTGNGFADFLFGAPFLFIQVDGDKVRNFRNTAWAAFFQDAYRVKKNLTLNYGVRWEVFRPFGDSNIHEVGHPRLATFIQGRRSTYAPDLPVGVLLAGFDEGVSETVQDTDFNNVAPRVGLAWDPFGNGKTSIRAGYGIFFDGGVLEAVINQSDGTPAIAPAAAPVLPGVGTMADPFLGNSPYRPPITFPIPTTTSIVPALVTTNNATGYAQQWNLTVQQQVFSNTMVQVAYVGTKGTKLPGSIDLAQACLASVQSPCNGITTNTTANLAARRPFPGLSGVLMVEPIFNSSYHGLQTGLNRRFDKGLSFQLSYTWSKAIDMTTRATRDVIMEGQANPQDFNNLAAERALSAIDVRNRFVANFAYELPFAKNTTGLVKAIAGDWQVNGIVTVQAGQPFTIVDSRQRSVTGGSGDRPDAVPGCDPNSGPQTTTQWFDTSCFQAVPLGCCFGTTGRNSVFADGIEQVDFSVLKTFSVNERSRFEFRAEFFNLFNHADFASPVNDFASTSFGRILRTAVEERQIQFGLKFSF